MVKDRGSEEATERKWREYILLIESLLDHRERFEQAAGEFETFCEGYTLARRNGNDPEKMERLQVLLEQQLSLFEHERVLYEVHVGEVKLALAEVEPLLNCEERMEMAAEFQAEFDQIERELVEIVESLERFAASVCPCNTPMPSPFPNEWEKRRYVFEQQRDEFELAKGRYEERREAFEHALHQFDTHSEMGEFSFDEQRDELAGEREEFLLSLRRFGRHKELFERRLDRFAQCTTEAFSKGELSGEMHEFEAFKVEYERFCYEFDHELEQLNASENYEEVER